MCILLFTRCCILFPFFFPSNKEFLYFWLDIAGYSLASDIKDANCSQYNFENTLKIIQTERCSVNIRQQWNLEKYFMQCNHFTRIQVLETATFNLAQNLTNMGYILYLDRVADCVAAGILNCAHGFSDTLPFKEWNLILHPWSVSCAQRSASNKQEKEEVMLDFRGQVITHCSFLFLDLS